MIATSIRTINRSSVFRRDQVNITCAIKSTPYAMQGAYGRHHRM